MESIFNSILGYLLMFIRKLISLIFVEVKLSNVSNITSEFLFNTLRDKLIEDTRFKFLTRSYEITEERDIKHGAGLFFCFNKYFYFAMIKYRNQPLADILQAPHIYINGVQIYTDENHIEKITTIKDMFIYIPFWKFDKDKNIVSEHQNEIERNYIQYIYRSQLIKEHDLSMFNQDDLKELDNIIDNKINNYDQYNNIISLESRHPKNVVETLAKKRNMNIYCICEWHSGLWGEKYDLESFNDFSKENEGKPFIFYLSCSVDDVATNVRQVFSQKNIKNMVFSMMSLGTPFVIIVDKSGYEQIGAYHEKYEEFNFGLVNRNRDQLYESFGSDGIHDNPRSPNIDLLISYSDKIKVRLNNA